MVGPALPQATQLEERAPDTRGRFMEVARRLSSEHRSPAHGPDDSLFPPFQVLNIGSSRTSELLGPGAAAFHASVGSERRDRQRRGHQRLVADAPVQHLVEMVSRPARRHSSWKFNAPSMPGEPHRGTEAGECKPLGHQPRESQPILTAPDRLGVGRAR